MTAAVEYRDRVEELRELAEVVECAGCGARDVALYGYGDDARCLECA